MKNLPLMIDIPQYLIQQLKNDFYARTTYDKNEMKKIVSIKEIESVNKVVEFLNMDITLLVGDNFYKHERAYFPHVDAPLIDSNKYLHVVIPIEKEYNEEQFFIIFDQTSKIGPATWTGLLDVDINFDYNKQIKGYIKKEDITNYSESKISEEFHKKYLPYPRDWYNGLSGVAIKWIPGTAIVFPSNRIHSTGKMPINANKLGLTLKFKMKNNVY